MSDDLEADFTAALEPIVLELEQLRCDLAACVARLNAPERAAELEQLRCDLAPLAPGLEQLRRELAAFGLRLEPLEHAAATLPAIEGNVTLLQRHRLDVAAWSAGVYRQGAVVQHFHGQYFEAVADTAAEPGDGVGWKRLGLAGFRYRGLWLDGANYEDGDLVQRDGSMLLHTAGAMTWLALRGKEGRRGAAGVGRPGDPGAPGAPGARGSDGAALVKLEASAGLLWAVMSDGRREPIALEAVAIEGTPS